MKYIVISYIPCEPDEPEIYDSYEEALEVVHHCATMQPGNHYEITEAGDPQ